MTSNAAVNKYISKMQRKLKCTKRKKNNYLSGLRQDINNFIAGNDDITYDGLCKRFGRPDDIADELLDANDYKRLLKKTRRATAVIVALCLFFGVVLAIEAQTMQDLWTTYNGTIESSGPFSCETYTTE